MESRYARQLLLPEIGAEGQRRLSDARVLIVGAGGLGSPVAAYLAGAGVGTIGIVDDDVVSVSNLQRQVLYDEGMVGRAKALCAKERLSALNSGIVVNACNERLTPDNAGRLIGGYDIVVDGTDNFAVRYVISDTCHAQGKPMVTGQSVLLKARSVCCAKGMPPIAPCILMRPHLPCRIAEKRLWALHRLLSVVCRQRRSCS